MKLITLLTDFGVEDGYPGIMKGVIWRIAPDTHIADITHAIRPQNILDGALALQRSVPYFPPGSVHVAVVDPGVGTPRRPIAARLGEQYFVGPDNGLVTCLLRETRRRGETAVFVHLDRPQFWLPQVSHSFHGRDVFAPAGAHLVNGTPLEALGTPIDDPIELDLPAPRRTPHGLQGQIIHIDHFGNLATNIEPLHVQGLAPQQVRIGPRLIPGIARTFGDGRPGDLLALWDSAGYLSISVVNGSAAARLTAQTGDAVEIIVDNPVESGDNLG
ncbi:MAG: SAM-dependent chlorinase/fluorinase [Chloroflexi bacterium]|nr:SAM-dependent chlorinase/fluorinase [Chloroflexota bacterium]